MKRGPTPTSDTKHAAIQRVPTVSLADEVIQLPQPRRLWLDSTTDAYNRYIESTAARVLRAEDIHEVVTLYDLVDARSKYIDQLSGDPDDDYKVLGCIRLVDQAIDRKSNNLGLGPLARTRLGIARMEQLQQEAAAVKASELAASQGEEF